MRRAILLAEDNEDDVFFFRMAAKKAGWSHEIVTAQNGREATELLGRFAAGEADLPRLDAAIVDLKMPFMGGLELLEWSQRKPELCFLPFIVLTSSEQESDIETAYRLGAASYLVKPAEPERMSDLVRAIEVFWIQQNRLPAAHASCCRTKTAAAV
jgi:CheY-like chemotaxis protein